MARKNVRKSENTTALATKIRISNLTTFPKPLNLFSHKHKFTMYVNADMDTNIHFLAVELI
jgi:hypothetical protein